MPTTTQPDLDQITDPRTRLVARLTRQLRLAGDEVAKHQEQVDHWTNAGLLAVAASAQKVLDSAQLHRDQLYEELVLVSPVVSDGHGGLVSR